MLYGKTVRTALASSMILWGGVALAQNQSTNGQNPSMSGQNQSMTGQHQPSNMQNMQRTETSINASQPLAFPPGFTTKDLHEENDIKSELGKVSSDLLEKNHFDNLVDALVKQDKDRVGSFKNRDANELNTKIDQIRTAWKAKYGKDFDIDYKNVFDNRFAILQGEVSDPALALNNWPVAVNGSSAIQASQVQTPANNNDKTLRKEESEAKLDKGRNAALVRIPAGDGFPEMTVSMLHELPDMWRFDIPNNRSGQDIYNDVLKNVNYISEHMNQLPADVNDAYRFVGRAAVASLYGVERESMNNPNQRP